jgi:hypothetical protein
MTTTLHPQHIADVNHDGFLDVIEGIPDYGPILISLDNDLGNFEASLDFPVANAQGRYFYTE